MKEADRSGDPCQRGETPKISDDKGSRWCLMSEGCRKCQGNVCAMSRRAQGLPVSRGPGALLKQQQKPRGRREEEGGWLEHEMGKKRHRCPEVKEKLKSGGKQ